MLAWMDSKTARSCLLLGPFIFTADLILLLWCEIILNVECLSDLLRRLSLDHIRDGFAANVKEGFDVKIICRLMKVMSVGS